MKNDGTIGTLTGLAKSMEVALKFDQTTATICLISQLGHPDKSACLL
jgi:hypothetical protein